MRYFSGFCYFVAVFSRNFSRYASERYFSGFVHANGRKTAIFFPKLHSGFVREIFPSFDSGFVHGNARKTDIFFLTFRFCARNFSPLSIRVLCMLTDAKLRYFSRIYIPVLCAKFFPSLDSSFVHGNGRKTVIFFRNKFVKYLSQSSIQVSSVQTNAKLRYVSPYGILVQFHGFLRVNRSS